MTESDRARRYAERCKRQTAATGSSGNYLWTGYPWGTTAVTGGTERRGASTTVRGAFFFSRILDQNAVVGFKSVEELYVWMREGLIAANSPETDRAHRVQFVLTACSTILRSPYINVFVGRPRFVKTIVEKLKEVRRVGYGRDWVDQMIQRFSYYPQEEETVEEEELELMELTEEEEELMAQGAGLGTGGQ